MINKIVYIILSVVIGIICLIGTLLAFKPYIIELSKDIKDGDTIDSARG